MYNFNSRRIFYSTTGGLFLALVTVSSVLADDRRDVVRDSAGHIIVNTFGNCVRTGWSRQDDPCAPRVVKKMPPVKHIRKAREMAQEERIAYFAFNSAVMMPQEHKKLDTLAEILKSDKEVKNVRIVGYADRIGSISYNKRLSELRAKNVEHYLHKRDYLNTSLATVRWLGESAPVTHCTNSLKRKELVSCLEKDRRVEVEIDYYPATR